MSAILKAAAAGLVLWFVSGCSSSKEEEIAEQAAEMAAAFKPPANPALEPMLGPMLDKLSKDVPALATRKAEILANEKALLAEAAASLVAAPAEGEAVDGAGSKIGATDTHQRFTARLASHKDIASWLIPAAHAQSGASGSLGSMTGFGGAYILGGSTPTATPGQTGSDSKSFTGKGGEKVTLSRSVDANGQTTTSVSSNVNIPQLGAEAGGMTSVTTGQMCPDNEGRVNLTMRVKHHGTAGGAAYSTDLEAKIKIVVGEKGEILSSDVESTFDSKSNGAAGKASAVGSMHVVGDGDGGTDVIDSKVSSASGDFTKLHEASMFDLHSLANGAILGAETHWRSGACVRIDASSPGKVKPGTVSDIDVKTYSKVDGGEIRAYMTAELSGGESVTPSTFGSPGKITHTAIDKKNATMTIKLSAASRRGMATEVLRISTDEAQYFAEGGGGDFHGSGHICDISQPFTISGSGVKMDFTPTSEKGGTYKYSGNMGGVSVYGGESYTVVYDGDVAVRINGTGVGCVRTPLGTFCAPGDEQYTLTKASEGNCGG